MPNYEFQCVKCKEIFEDTVPVGQRTHKCPHCGGKAKKLISTVGIIFKGSGFYCTDNRSGSDGNGSKNVDKKTEKAKPKASKKPDKPKIDE